MALPAKPVRKAARTGNDNLARPTSKSVPGKSAYPRKASSRAQASKSTYVRKSAGISPATHNIQRTAGDASQPHNNPGRGTMPGSRGRKVSKLGGGVD
jgi:hypothetical protein